MVVIKYKIRERNKKKWIKNKGNKILFKSFQYFSKINYVDVSINIYLSDKIIIILYII